MVSSGEKFLKLNTEALQRRAVAQSRRLSFLPTAVPFETNWPAMASHLSGNWRGRHDIVDVTELVIVRQDMPAAVPAGCGIRKIYGTRFSWRCQDLTLAFRLAITGTVMTMMPFFAQK